MSRPWRVALPLLILIAALAAFWWWPGDAAVLGPIDVAAAAELPTIERSAAGGAADPWAQATEATRRADDTLADGAPCFPPRPGESLEETEERSRRETEAVAARHAQTLASAGDDLGRMTSAMLVQDFPRIVEVAAASRDPVVYGLGLRVCAHKASPAVCGALSVDRWLALDPDNAAAWRMKAALATTPEAAWQAMKGADTATHELHLRGQLLKRIAADVRDFATLRPLAQTASGLDAAQWSTFATAFENACGRAAPADPARRHTCEGFAKRAANDARDAFDRLIVVTTAQRAGLLPAELNDTRAQMKAVLMAVNRWLVPEGASPAGPSCAMVRRQIAFELAVADEGDIAAIRRLASEAPLDQPQGKR